jgi:hypothetical protein
MNLNKHETLESQIYNSLELDDFKPYGHQETINTMFWGTLGIYAAICLIISGICWWMSQSIDKPQTNKISNSTQNG